MLQKIEDEIIGHRARRVIARTARGMFQWKPLLEKPGQERAEEISGEAFRELERIVLAEGWSEIVIGTQRGFFRWKKREDFPDAMGDRSPRATDASPEKPSPREARRR